MLKIFLSSHGRFASGIRSSCEILLGAQQNLTVFDAYVDNDTVQEHLDDFYKTVQKVMKSNYVKGHRFIRTGGGVAEKEGDIRH